MIRTILAAYDGSPHSSKAFLFALDIAEKFGAAIAVLSVARPPEPPEAVEMEAVIESATEFYSKQFADLESTARERGVAVRQCIRVGHPAEQIILAAKEQQADLIVMGHRGKNILARWLLGSISKRVLSYAPCSVLIVR